MYRIELVPSGIWVIVAIAMLLMLLMAFSIAVSSSRTKVVFIGPEIRTGDPADYVEQPAPSPAPLPEAGSAPKPGP